MPKPFKFRLDRVLDYRGQLEEQAKAEFAKAQKAFNDQRGEVQRLEGCLEVHMGKQRESRESANDMWLWQQYKDALEQDISVARIELSRLEHTLQKCRQTVIERSRDKKLLEKLKETQARKHNEEESALEEKENDEMATIRYEPENL